jgi:hypothetical protein
MARLLYLFKRLARDWTCSRCRKVVLQGDLMAVPAGAGANTKRLCCACFDAPRPKRREKA